MDVSVLTLAHLTMKCTKEKLPTKVLLLLSLLLSVVDNSRDDEGVEQPMK